MLFAQSILCSTYIFAAPHVWVYRQDSDCAAGATIRLPRVCAAPGCGATRGLRRCGGCGTVRYCSAACSRAHWRAHKGKCRRLQAAKAAATADDAAQV